MADTAREADTAQAVRAQAAEVAREAEDRCESKVERAKSKEQRVKSKEQPTLRRKRGFISRNLNHNSESRSQVLLGLCRAARRKSLRSRIKDERDSHAKLRFAQNDGLATA